MVKYLFTNDVALHLRGESRPEEPKPYKVSNLVQNPKMNAKYDDAWYL
jgi:hypothetical protein